MASVLRVLEPVMRTRAQRPDVRVWERLIWVSATASKAHPSLRFWTQSDMMSLGSLDSMSWRSEPWWGRTSSMDERLLRGSFTTVHRWSFRTAEDRRDSQKPHPESSCLQHLHV